MLRAGAGEMTETDLSPAYGPLSEDNLGSGHTVAPTWLASVTALSDARGRGKYIIYRAL